LRTTIHHDINATRPLTESEIRAETRAIRSYLASEIEARWGGTMTLRVEFNRRFTRRLGDALVVDYAKRIVRLRFSASALYRRATAEERRVLWVHEYAHGAANLDAGRSVKHKAPWKRMMVRLGVAPDRCHTVNRDGLRRRRTRRRRGTVILRPATIRRVERPVVRPTATVGASVSFRLRGVRGTGRVVSSTPSAVRLRVVGDHGRVFFGEFVTLSPSAL